MNKKINKSDLLEFNKNYDGTMFMENCFAPIDDIPLIGSGDISNLLRVYQKDIQHGLYIDNIKLGVNFLIIQKEYKDGIMKIHKAKILGLYLMPDEEVSNESKRV